MHRIDTPTAQKDKFGAGKNGFTRGNPQTGVQATALDDDYFDMLQEELVGVVESAGLKLTKTNKAQLVEAIKKHISNAAPVVVQTTGTSTTSLMSQDATTKAINSVKTSVVQTTGTSTTDVMSQKSVTDAFLQIPSQVKNVNDTASAVNNPFTGFGYFNTDVGFFTKYGMLLQTSLKGGGMLSIAQQAVSDVNAPVRVFARNGKIDTTGNAEFGKAVEFYHTENLLFTASKSQNGYQKLPGGLIIQWGRFVLPTSNGPLQKNITFPIAFPNAYLSITATAESSNSYAESVEIGSFSTTGFGATTFYINGGSVLAHAGIVQWMAIGY